MKDTFYPKVKKKNPYHAGFYIFPEYDTAKEKTIKKWKWCFVNTQDDIRWETTGYFSEEDIRKAYLSENYSFIKKILETEISVIKSDTEGNIRKSY